MIIGSVRISPIGQVKQFRQCFDAIFRNKFAEFSCISGNDFIIAVTSIKRNEILFVPAVIVLACLMQHNFCPYQSPDSKSSGTNRVNTAFSLTWPQARLISLASFGLDIGLKNGRLVAFSH